MLRLRNVSIIIRWRRRRKRLRRSLTAYRRGRKTRWGAHPCVGVPTSAVSGAVACVVSLRTNTPRTFPPSDFSAAGRPCGDDAEGSGSVVWEAARYGQRRPPTVQPAPGILQGDDVVKRPLHLTKHCPIPHDPQTHSLLSCKLHLLRSHTVKIKEIQTQE